MATRIGKEDFENKVIKSELPVLVDFYSDNCVPCKRMTPVIEKIEDESKNRINVYKVNVDLDGELALKYEIMAVPTLILFLKEKELARTSGVSSKDWIVNWIEGVINSLI